MIPGKYYKVFCVRMDALNDVFYPVIDHPHNDIENGQKDVHYHIDPRFMDIHKEGRYTTDSRNPFMRIREDSILQKEYFMLMYNGSSMINDSEGITPTKFISKSKLKHKCIHKGKCPHRGYDLSQVEAVAGVITCPLHGLQFNSDNLKLIEHAQKAPSQQPQES